MSVVYRTAGAWGGGKGSNLTPAEVDENFWTLVQEILSENSDEPLPVGIANITVTGSLMQITLDDARVMGPFILPKAVFRWQGAWVPSTIYGRNDVFSVDGHGVFLVLEAFTSGLTFDPAEEVTDGPVLQQLMADPGTGSKAYTGVREFTGTDIDFSSEMTLTRAGTIWRCHNDVTTTVWLPDGSDIDYPIGAKLFFELVSPYGNIHFQAPTGGLEHLAAVTTVASAHYAMIEAIKVAEDSTTQAATWLIRGDLDP